MFVLLLSRGRPRYVTSASMFPRIPYLAQVFSTRLVDQSQSRFDQVLSRRVDVRDWKLVFHTTYCRHFAVACPFTWLYFILRKKLNRTGDVLGTFLASVPCWKLQRNVTSVWLCRARFSSQQRIEDKPPKSYCKSLHAGWFCGQIWFRGKGVLVKTLCPGSK